MMAKWMRFLLLILAIGWAVSTPAQPFTEVAASAGVNGTGGGIAWGDYDNDGRLDIYVGADGPDQLYRNQGDGTFAEMGKSAGIADSSNGVAVAWGDYDNDGDLDLYLANRRTVEGEGVNRLYRNNGDGKFTDVAANSGVASRGDMRGVTWGDYDNDGDLDLYTVDDGEPDQLYRNNGDGTFADVGTSVGVYDDNAPGRGAVWGDYDNDGDLDLYVTNINIENRLYRNNGDGKFTDVAASVGMDSREGHADAWGDYDNDGDLDLYVVAKATNLLYRNKDDGKFTEVAAELGVNAIEPFGSAAAWGDYDSDGDLDLYVGNIDTPNLLYRNEGTPNYWLQVKLTGTESNRSAIGAKAIAVAGGKRQRRDVDGGSGFCSQPSLPVEFGFGQTAMVDSLIIRWPSGIVQTFTRLETNQRLAIVESNPLITAVEEEAVALPSTFSLSQNYPNPFNPQTTIHYQVPQEAEVRLSILDLAGQEVRTLTQGVQQPGRYSVVWDGTDAEGRSVASGVYVYRLEVMGQGVVEIRRMALVR